MASRPGIRNYRFSFNFYITPAVQWLLIANVGIFFFEILLRTFWGISAYNWFVKAFGLVPFAVTHGLRFWQPFSPVLLSHRSRRGSHQRHREYHSGFLGTSTLGHTNDWRFRGNIWNSFSVRGHVPGPPGHDVSDSHQNDHAYLRHRDDRARISRNLRAWGQQHQPHLPFWRHARRLGLSPPRFFPLQRPQLGLRLAKQAQSQALRGLYQQAQKRPAFPARQLGQLKALNEWLRSPKERTNYLQLRTNKGLTLARQLRETS